MARFVATIDTSKLSDEEKKKWEEYHKEKQRQLSLRSHWDIVRANANTMLVKDKSCCISRNNKFGFNAATASVGIQKANPEEEIKKYSDMDAVEKDSVVIMFESDKPTYYEAPVSFFKLSVKDMKLLHSMIGEVLEKYEGE